MRIGLTDEPWGRYVKIGLDGKVLDPIQPDERYASTYKLFEVLGTNPHDRVPTRTAILMRQPVSQTDPENPLHRYAFEFRAIDTEGNNHWAIEWEGRGIEGTQLNESQYGLASPGLPAGKTLSHYEYRVRPYRHWITFTGVSLEPGKESTVKVKVESLPTEPLRLRVKDARGGQARFNSVAVATVGFPKAPPDIEVKLDRKADAVRQLPKSASDVWPRSPNREGIVSLDGLPVGTHWLLAAGDSPERLPFPVTIPKEQPLLERRLRHPAWLGKKVEFGRQPIVELDDKEGEVIVVEIHNQSNEALSFSEEDIVLLSKLDVTKQQHELLRGLSPKWLTADREPFPQTKIEAGQTGRTRLNWREWVRKGLWSSRNHETIAEPGFPPNEPGKIWVKAGLGNGGSLPVSVTEPQSLLMTSEITKK